MKKIPVILDTDIGGDIDDTWALGMMLLCPELDVKLVVSDQGDTLYRSSLIAKLLTVADRTDIPVGIGIRQNSDSGPQAPWLSGYELSSYPGIVHNDGVGVIIETINQSPEPVTLIGIGPVPNIAAALERDPAIARKARFVGMHGSIRKQHDGKPGAIPEWNVVADVAACRKVFTAPWLDMTITPLDTCGIVRLEGERYQKMLASNRPIARAIIENYAIWNLKNSAEDSRTRSSILFDTVAIHLAFSTRFLTMQKMGVRVTDDGFTREDATAQKMNVALEWADLEGYLDYLLERLVS